MNPETSGAAGESSSPISLPTPTTVGDEPPSDDISAIVRRPTHYAKFAIEPITFIMVNGFEFWRGNIIKYAARAGSKAYDGMDAVKSEITDLEKVRRYAEMRINQLKGEDVL
jgi:hypothetical protein